jgi:hypothetical protein
MSVFKHLFLIFLSVYTHSAAANPMTAKSDSKDDSDSKSQASSSARTGQQTVTINIPAPTKVIYRTRRKVVKKMVFKINPNRFQLLVGQSKTHMAVYENDASQFRAARTYEPDFGLMYLRDFGAFTGSVTGTLNRGYYVGLGVNW